jgi:hypothetical protein
VFRGRRARVEVRQGPEQGFRPELYVIPVRAADKAAVLQALERCVRVWQAVYPGTAVHDQGERLWVSIPDPYRTGHEAHFAQVTRQFLGYLQDRSALAAWEKPNMLAKYYVTTRGVELSRQTPEAIG